MQCPHCRQHFHAGSPATNIDFGADNGRRLFQESYRCAACNRLIVLLKGHVIDPATNQPVSPVQTVTTLMYPRAASRPPVAPEVPAELARAYTEACLILNDSPMASAALARRCLQHILRDKAGVKEKTLVAEIEKVLASKTLPSHIAKVVDAIRHFGNFSAHPTTDINTGEIIAVEEGEAEWTIDIVERLFGFYYVEPVEAQARLDALNAKLQQAGKPAAK